mmetsp:Transcript_132906/g.284060  ORF Transcript_132906/g.284060 Transcript_132906/m.284060 type:complete len:962 (-) Transcript_132906:50-2935(-)
MAILEATFNIICGAETEIAIFLIAIIAHALLFGKYRIINKHTPVKIRKSGKTASVEHTKAKAEVEKQPSVPPSSALPFIRTIRTLMHNGAGEELLLEACLRETASLAPEAVVDAFVAILGSPGVGQVSTSLMAAVRKAALKRDLPCTARLSELLLRSYFRFHLMEDFSEILAEADAAKVRTPAMTIMELRIAIDSKDLEVALACIKGLAKQWELCHVAAPTASNAPLALLQKLAHLCSEKGALKILLEEFRTCNALSPAALQCVLVEYAQCEDAEGLRWAEELATEQAVELTAASCCALVRGAIIASAGDRAACDAAVLRRFDKGPPGVDYLSDSTVGRCIADAALRCGRKDVLSRLMASAAEGSRQIVLLKSFATDKRLDDALALFEASSEKTSWLYNAFLDACVECGDCTQAQCIMDELISKNIADAVTYNTMIKAHLVSGHPKRARETLTAMQSAGLKPNAVTYNQLLEATTRTSPSEAWALIDEMKSCGILPDQVTCSILLKVSTQKTSRVEDLERTLTEVNSLEEQMGEILFASICEACMRTGRRDLLVSQLDRYQSSKTLPLRGAHAYGSIIRAYGYIGDLASVWKLWHEMRASNILPTSITMGCMVEAVVTLDDPESGYELIQAILNDSQTRPLLNAVIYCSVLKGFSHAKRFERVWTVYEEMRAEKLQFSIVTYNALVDVCARSFSMGRVKQLLEEMAGQDIEPNMITYSTIIKGYCQENRLDRAFELLANMKKASQLRPDEITYNSLLDGCARHGFWDRGNGLLADMQRFGVRPSNFTLSVVVKLANRSKRPEQAFELCDELCKKYNIRPNVHVYNNLVHTCTTHYPATRRALEVFEQMLSEKVRPDTRTYTLLIKGCLSAKDAQDVAGLLRGAVGLRGVHPSIARFEKGLVQPRGGLPSEFIAETLEGLASQCGALQLAMQLLSDLSCVPGIRLDSKLHMRLTSRAINGRF